jgi:diaminopimelate epimerase
MLSFAKYEGIGNDFVVVDAENEAGLSVEQAKELCDRHFGIGADGVLLVLPPSLEGARARMVVLNADGSRPEMCGNRLRCVALHLSRSDERESADYLLETDAGPRTATVARRRDRGEVSLGMGRGLLGSELVTEHGGQALRFSRISMGNPHAVAFDTGLDERALDELGPRVSAGEPGGTNVEVVTRVGPQAFSVLVWERGVGRTLACGTGAAAVAVMAAVSGRASFDEPIEVLLPGGPLSIVVAKETLEVTLRGPARLVFSGQVAP